MSSTRNETLTALEALAQQGEVSLYFDGMFCVGIYDHSFQGYGHTLDEAVQDLAQQLALQAVVRLTR